MLDKLPRWSQATPIVDQYVDSVAEVFPSTWISRYRPSSGTTADQGTQFESALFIALAKLLDCKRTRTSLYHSASNGANERWDCFLKVAITCCEGTPHWVDVMPMILLGLRTSVKERLNASSADMLFGTSLRLPGGWLLNDDSDSDSQGFLNQLRLYMRENRPKAIVHRNNRVPFVNKELRSCPHVFVRLDPVKGPLSLPFTKPHRVITRILATLYRVKLKFETSFTEIDLGNPLEHQSSPSPMLPDIADVLLKLHPIQIQQDHRQQKFLLGVLASTFTFQFIKNPLPSMFLITDTFVTIWL